MAAMTSGEAPPRLKKKRKAGRRTRGQVEFNSDDNMEYCVPLDSCNQSPMPTLSCSSESSKSKYLDEIALLKRGKITRDTPRHTYKRGYAGSDPLTKDNDEPITLAELNSRGLRIDDEHVIYCLPENNTHAEEISKSMSSRHSVVSSDSSRNSGWSFISSPQDVKEFSVGHPDENATLKISSLSHKGQSYELNTGSDVCVLQQSPKNVVLITWKN